MGVEAAKWARSVKTGHVGSKFVLQHLAELCDDKTGRCYASHRNLAAWTEQGKRTVQRCIDSLVQLGFLERIPRTDPTTEADIANGYQVKAPWVELELAILSLNLPPMANSATPPSQNGQPPMAIAVATPHGHSCGHPEVEVRGESTTTSSPRSSKPREGEEVVNDLWKRLRPLILAEWHGGDEEVWINGDRCGLGLEKVHLGQLVYFHGAEATELAIASAPRVWTSGWPRTLAWFTNPEHGADNFHRAKAYGLKRGRTTASSGPLRIAEIVRQIVPSD